jgi:hypothetical protein
MTRIAADDVLRSFLARCEHCLGVLSLVTLKDGRELAAERVGDHFEPHDCRPKGWHAKPAAQDIH